jgi:hypothetical protein
VRRVCAGLILLLAAVANCGCDGLASAAPAGEARALRTTAILGEVGMSPGQMVYPRSIDNDGRAIWIIDKAARVQRLDAQTGDCTAIWQMPEFAKGKPCGITVGPPPPGLGEGPIIYIPDTHYHRVMLYRAPPSREHPPELVASFGSYGAGPGEFVYPTDVAVLPGPDGAAERIYVAEYGDNDRISVFGPDLEFLFAFGATGSGPGPEPEFNRPQSIALDAERRELYVVDACNHRVGVFTLEGGLVRWIGSPDNAGGAPDQISYPYGIALLGDGTALVTEFGNHRVRHIDMQSGETLTLLGSPGAGRGHLSVPWGITLIGDTAYVLDSGNGRIQAFPAPAKRRGHRAGSGGAG